MIISDANLSDDKNITDSKENQQNLCYIYKHIRLDTNVVFYIGKSINTNGKYERSANRDGRNPHWYNVVNKVKYRIEIVIDNLSEDEADKKEIELILHYGRIDLGTGTLVNKTEGGDGGRGRVVLKETIEKRKNTHLERYGFENAFQIPEIKEKIKQNNLIRYGFENSFQSEDIRNKAKATNLEKYGVENVFQSEEIKEKIKHTNLEKYGVEHPSQSEEIRNKVKTTNIERLGVEYASQSPKVKDTVRQTNLNNHGVENVFQSEEIKEKIKQTNLEKYGATHYTKTEEFKEKMRKTWRCKKVGQYKDGNLINEYPSINSTKDDGFSSGNVRLCCMGKQKHHKGFEWKFI